jgi:hypothetical protein
MATIDTFSQRIALEGDDTIAQQFAKLQAAGEKAFAAIRAAADKAGSGTGAGFDAGVKRFQASVARLQAAGRQLQTQFARLEIAAARFGGALRSTGLRVAALWATVSAAATAAAVGMFKYVQASVQAVDTQGKMAQQLGLTIDAYERLAFGAQLAGVRQEDFATVITKLNQKIVELVQTGKKTGPVYDEITASGVRVRRGIELLTDKTIKNQGALARMGITVRDVRGQLLSSEVILLAVADVFQKMPDGAQKSALAVELFGESGRRLIPFLNDGAAGIRRLGEEATRLGLVFTPAQFAAAQVFNDALATMRGAISGALTSLGLIFAPLFTTGFTFLTELIVKDRDATLAWGRALRDALIPSLRDAIELFRSLVLGDEVPAEAFFTSWAAAANEAGIAVRHAFTDIIIPAFDLVRSAADKVTAAINGIFGTRFTTGQLLVATAILKLSGALGLVTAGLGVLRAASGLVLPLLKGLAISTLVLWNGLVLVGQGFAVVVAGIAGLIGLPVAVVAAIAAAIVAAGVAIFVFWDDITAAARTAWDIIVRLAGAAVARAAALWRGLVAIWDAIAAAAEAAWARVSALFSPEGLAAAWAAIVAAAEAAWAGVVAAADAAWAAIVAAAAALPGQIAAAIAGLDALLGAAFDAAASVVTAIWSGMIDTLKAGLDALVAVAQSVAARIAAIISSILSKLRGAQAETSGSGGGGFAAGGRVSGPGTSTSDSIPAWLSHGEFVIRAAAVRRYGPRLFAALNALALPLDVVPRFSLGGLAAGIEAGFAHAFQAPRMAMGGLASPAAPAGAPLTLILPSGRQIAGTVSASRSAIAEIKAMAMREKTLSAGRRAGYVGA